MPEELLNTQEEKEYEDSDVLIPYTDPYSKKEFYPALPSEKNINNPNVFLVDVDDSGNPVYGTYNKDDRDIEYQRQVIRNYKDNSPQKVFALTTKLNQLLTGQNPYSDRKYLQDYSPNLYDNPALNERVTAMRSRFAPQQVVPQQVAQIKTPQQAGEDYINRLKKM